MKKEVVLTADEIRNVLVQLAARKAGFSEGSKFNFVIHAQLISTRLTGGILVELKTIENVTSLDEARKKKKL